jgi:hypothetical protein
VGVRGPLASASDVKVRRSNWDRIEIEDQAAIVNRSHARITVTADHGLPVGVATLRSFRMRAISRAGLTCSSSNNGASAFARSIAASLASRP